MNRQEFFAKDYHWLILSLVMLALLAYFVFQLDIAEKKVALFKYYEDIIKQASACVRPVVFCG